MTDAVFVPMVDLPMRPDVPDAVKSAPADADRLTELIERAVFDASAVRGGGMPTADSSWWHIHRSGPTHTKWAADAVMPFVDALLGERDRARRVAVQLEQELHQSDYVLEVTGRKLDMVKQERDQLRKVARHAANVMATLEQYGPGIVGHLLDSDDNSGQFLRDALHAAGVVSSFGVASETTQP